MRRVTKWGVRRKGEEDEEAEGEAGDGGAISKADGAGWQGGSSWRMEAQM